MTCDKALAEGQYWNYCGETDMGQTDPVRCTHCGGDLIREEDVNHPSVIEVITNLVRENHNLRKQLEKEQ